MPKAPVQAKKPHSFTFQVPIEEHPAKKQHALKAGIRRLKFRTCVEDPVVEPDRMVGVCNQLILGDNW